MKLICSLSLMFLLTGCSAFRVQSISQSPIKTVTAAAIPESDDDDPKADSPDKAAQFLRKQRWQGPGAFPSERYLTARKNARLKGRVALEAGRMVARETPRSSPGFGTGWKSLGPGNVGGRVRALVVDPTNDQIIYAASATGGVWKTTDAGQTWAPLTDFLPVLSATSLVMDPSNPQVLYLGTGEYQLWGNGIFQTTDGGSTWNQLPSTDNTVTNGAFQFVNQIAISPARPANLYAATETGLYVSTNSGSTWTQALPGTISFCDSVVVRGDQPTDIAYAACGGYSSTGNTAYSIYTNTDAAGSGTWNVVQTDPMMSTTALAIAPSLPTTIYAISMSSDSTGPFRDALYAVFQSTAGGAAGTWVKRADTTNPVSITANILSYLSCSYDPTDHHGQAYYDMVIAVDPTNPNTVFVGGIYVFRSDDGGLTFGVAEGQNNLFPHVDQHALAFGRGYNGTTNQTIFLGNDGGVFETDNALGAAPSSQLPGCPGVSGVLGVGWNSLVKGFLTTQFYHGTIMPGGATYFGGAQDNGTSIGNDSTGINGWLYLAGGDGGQVMADPVENNNLFYEYTLLNIQKSTDGGITGEPATNGITEPSANFNFINYYTYDPSDPLKMYTGGSQIWRSVDGAQNWTAASAPVPFFPISVEAVDPADPNTVYFGTSSGAQVYRTSNALTADGTTAWASTQLRSDGYVSRIAFDPNLVNRVYATFETFRYSSTDAQIYVSDDRGVTWAPVGNGPNGLPDIPVSTILVDPDSSSTLYVGTDIGVFVSYDSGNTWTQAAAPFADAQTTTLQIEREGAAKTLYAFTFGRGVWKLNLSGGAPCSYSLSTNSVTATADETQGSLNVTAAAGCPWSAQSGFITAVQSPATGNGPGTVFYDIQYNGDGTARTDTFYVQGMPVTVSQSTTTAVSHSILNDEIASAKVVNPLPYDDDSYNQFTSDSTDPVHSCTGSADQSTRWYTLAATANQQLSVSAISQSLTDGSDAGLVITAYPLTGSTIGAEIVCGTIPQNSTTLTTLDAQFPVQAGKSYAIEFSVPNATQPLISLRIAALPNITITSAASQVTAGGKVQFAASVLGSIDTGVRWFVSPPQAGQIDQTGLFTAPASVSGSTTATITARSFADATQTASANLTVVPGSTSFTAAGVANAASYQNGIVAPGELVAIFGTNLGPSTLAGLQLGSNGNVATTAGGTQVLFDGIAAPMIYSLSGQIAAVVPFEVAGEAATQVVVSYNGQQSPAVAIPVTTALPALFTSNGSGSGQAAALNQDLSLNGPGNGAAAGSIVVLYGTGAGQTTPAGVDGQLSIGTYPSPVLPLTVTIGGQPASVAYAGAAPYLVAGVFQINVYVPPGTPSGNQPVMITSGSQSSPATVTITVQ